MEVKYVIRIGCKTSNNSSYQWCYYNGHTYKCKDECYIDDLVKIDKAKRYSNQKNAEKAAEKLKNKCANVDVWLVEEVEE